MEREKNNNGLYKEIFIHFTTKEALLHTHQGIQKHKSHYKELNSDPDLFQKYKGDASIQREINMIREAAQNIIDRIKDILNENITIFERYERNIIEAQQIKYCSIKLTWMKSAIPLKN